MRGSASVLLLVCLLPTAPRAADAQQLSYSKGQPVYPAYEGWERNPDGSVDMLFGYMNDNWEQELEIPVGLSNHFSPGPPDQGQPPEFFPRSNRYGFQVRVPADVGAVYDLDETHRAKGTG